MTKAQILKIELTDQDATSALAAEIAGRLQQGDVVALSGDLGAGKTAFARAYIQARGQQEGLLIDEVPSPTFTIVQVYDELDPPVWHVDLYRLEGRADTFELGLEEAFEDGITLIEWPDRLGDDLPSNHLSLHLHINDRQGARIAELTEYGGTNRLAGLEASLD